MRVSRIQLYVIMKSLKSQYYICANWKFHKQNVKQFIQMFNSCLCQYPLHSHESVMPALWKHLHIKCHQKCLDGEIGGGKAVSRRGERIWKNTEVDRAKRCCKEKRGETEIEEVVGCARRGEVGKVNNRIGVKHETWNLKSLGENEAVNWR